MKHPKRRVSGLPGETCGEFQDLSIGLDQSADESSCRRISASPVQFASRDWRVLGNRIAFPDLGPIGSPLAEYLAVQNALRRKARHLYFGRIGYVTQPKTDRRGEPFFAYCQPEEEGAQGGEGRQWRHGNLG